MLIDFSDSLQTNVYEHFFITLNMLRAISLMTYVVGFERLCYKMILKITNTYFSGRIMESTGFWTVHLFIMEKVFNHLFIL